jgi:signal transduction histidine kinase
LLNIVNDILDLSKIEAGQMQVRPEWLEVQDVARDAVSLFVARARAAGIDIDLETNAARLYADPRAAHQILLNLLSNAVKFTPAGGRIVVRAHETADGVALSVADTGCGIAPETLSGLFQPFMQADNTFERTHGGTGLGLALVRSLARLHGGDASIESAEGKGTTVTVVFPVQQPAAIVAA